MCLRHPFETRLPLRHVFFLSFVSPRRSRSRSTPPHFTSSTKQLPTPTLHLTAHTSHFHITPPLTHSSARAEPSRYDHATRRLVSKCFFDLFVHYLLLPLCCNAIRCVSLCATSHCDPVLACSQTHSSLFSFIHFCFISFPVPCLRPLRSVSVRMRVCVCVRFVCCMCCALRWVGGCYSPVPIACSYHPVCGRIPLISPLSLLLVLPDPLSLDAFDPLSHAPSSQSVPHCTVHHCPPLLHTDRIFCCSAVHSPAPVPPYHSRHTYLMTALLCPLCMLRPHSRRSRWRVVVTRHDFASGDASASLRSVAPLRCPALSRAAAQICANTPKPKPTQTGFRSPPSVRCTASIRPFRDRCRSRNHCVVPRLSSSLRNRFLVLERSNA